MHRNREQTVVRDLASLYDRNPLFPTAKALVLVVAQNVYFSGYRSLTGITSRIAHKIICEQDDVIHQCRYR